MSEIQQHSTFVNGTHDQVVFENVPDQYVKGENVTAHFTILHDIKVNINEDRIGLLRVCFLFFIKIH
jgi:hypothetical protein